MTKRYTGGVVSSAVPTVNAAGASGVFLLSQQTDAAAKNNWPPFKVEKSLRFRAAGSAYLSRTPAVAGNRKTWTWSGWVKRGKITSGQTLFYGQPDGSTVSWNGTNFYFLSDDTLRLQQGNSPNGYYTTSAVFRDPSAWYHILLAVDTT